MGKLQKPDAEWRNKLTPEQYHVCRQCSTEPPFTGLYWDCHPPHPNLLPEGEGAIASSPASGRGLRRGLAGIYRCVCCGNALFDSETKFDSGSGWPSFWQAIREGALKLAPDNTRGMERIEVRCAKCNAHLGHVFEDGPEPTGLRFCINSASLALDRK